MEVIVVIEELAPVVTGQPDDDLFAQTESLESRIHREDRAVVAVVLDANEFLRVDPHGDEVVALGHTERARDRVVDLRSHQLGHLVQAIHIALACEGRFEGAWRAIGAVRIRNVEKYKKRQVVAIFEPRNQAVDVVLRGLPVIPAATTS